MRKTQFEPLEIRVFEESVFHLPTHGHTYYEIIYIIKGSGIHLLNNNHLPYKTDDLFVLSPEDEHYFEIMKSTRFAMIKFTDSYFSSKNHLCPDEFLRTPPETIMRNKLLKEVRLVLDEPCKTILRNVVENIIAYNCRKDVATSPVVYYQILTIFGLIKEAMAKMMLHIDNDRPDKESLISFIHQHIYEPEKIQVNYISGHFNIAANYFGAYFKRNFGVGYREYINHYRITLIERRLTAGQLSMKQIADEFGFTDESHLSNYFKNRNQTRPALYRKGLRANEYRAT
jgi:AraC-like DNA-binding protein/mannose-6-phosphate isomerase-like protein (cupin superfamily)